MSAIIISMINYKKASVRNEIIIKILEKRKYGLLSMEKKF